jgi:biotin-(acetyl-CoA carboxylase) ligase
MPQSGSVKENLQQSSGGPFGRKWLSPKGILVLLTVARDTAAIPHATMLPIALAGDQTWRGVNANTFLV